MISCLLKATSGAWILNRCPALAGRSALVDRGLHLSGERRGGVRVVGAVDGVEAGHQAEAAVRFAEGGGQRQEDAVAERDIGRRRAGLAARLGQ